MTGRPGGGPPSEQEDATIIPIEALTREATFRRLAELARRTDGPPPEVVQELLAIPARARAAASSPTRRAGSTPPTERWRSVDDELAVLSYDSEYDEEEVASLRSGSGARRRLSFEAPEVSLEVEVTLSRPRSLVCQLVPAQPATLEIRHGDGAVDTLTDPFGTFHSSSIQPGVLSFWCQPHLSEASSVATSWIRI